MTPPPAIETRNLTKHYHKFTAVNNLSLTINPGEIFGFLGPNGAGKTTTIRMMTTLTRPTHGTTIISGYDCTHHPITVKQHLGYMPDVAGFYGDLTATTTLLYYSDFYHIPTTERKQRITTLLNRLELTDFADKKVKTFSRGMKQKLAFASAIIHHPDILILDEPTIGLDPPTIHFFRTLIRELNTEGMTIFLSSHTLSEVEAICHRVGIINKGHLIAIDTINALRTRLMSSQNQHIIVDVENITPAALDALRTIPGVLSIKNENNTLHIELEKGTPAIPQIAHTLVHQNINITGITSKKADLEDIFLAAIKGGTP